MFDGRIVVALGERDGVAGPAVAACARAAGAEGIFSATQFLVTASEAMDRGDLGSNP
jgi:glycine reductase